MSFPLTKSHVSKCDPNNPAMMNLTLNKLFDRTKEEKYMTELINIETGQHTTNLAILGKGEKYARGLLTLGLEPGVDNIAVIGCATFEAPAIFAAAAEIGCGFSHLFLHPPRSKQIVTQLPVIAPKVVIVGEGAGGCTFKALVSFFDADKETPTSERLPFVERIFYDSSYKDRSPSHKFIQTLDELIKLGENVSDEQLLQAKLKVKPEFLFQHLFTSGSTGAPKCASRTQASLAYFASNTVHKDNAVLVMNINVDTLASYTFVTLALTRPLGKLVMIPETYEENPLKNQGKLITEIVLNEKIVELPLTMSALTAFSEYIRTNNIEIPQPMAVLYAGQVVSRQFIEENEKYIKGLHLIGYGITELIAVAYTAFGNSENEIASRKEGRLYAASNSQIRIVDENDHVVDIGVMGEVHAKIPTLIKEYRNDPVNTQKSFTEDGFFRTGDHAVMFADGSIKLKGRIANHERFKIFGKVEYAGPLEEIFNQHPDISQAYAVSGKRNNWIGDEITCCIKMKATKERIPEDKLFRACEEKGMYLRQRPARIIYMDEFPLTDNGRKVSKLKLTAQVQAMVAEDEEVGKCKWFAEMERSGKTY